MPTHPQSARRRMPVPLRNPNSSGFALVVTLSLMVLLTLLAVGLLSLSAVELRKSRNGEAQAIAMANARVGLMLALSRLQTELGDDRRISADASILPSSKHPAAIGVWNGWSPDAATKSGGRALPRIDYQTPKGQTGFRSWLVSAVDSTKTRELTWHASAPAETTDPARLFTETTSGFDLTAEKIPLPTQAGYGGTVAWAVTQENTKARINIGVDDKRRPHLEDRIQAPARPDLSLASILKQPTDDWTRRSASICDLPQAVLDPAYGTTRQKAAKLAKDHTTTAYSLLTNPVNGGLKVDLNTGFELTDGEFATDSWGNGPAKVVNPFRSTIPREYRGQKPLFQPLVNNPMVRVLMDFNPASVNHKFPVNGVPTFDTLRAYYRTYRHLYKSNAGGVTAFERPYAHIATAERVADRPFGKVSQPALVPVLDRSYFILSIVAKADGSLGVLITPFVTIWNPHSVAIESEGMVVYPWIDFAVGWNYSINKQSGGTVNWGSSLSRVIGEGYQGSAGERHGRSSRPYFYLHLTEQGKPVRPGTRTISPLIHLQPGEVRVFCLADNSRKDLETSQGAAARTWLMKAVSSPSDLTSSLKGGVFLNCAKAIAGSQLAYRLQPGDRINANTVQFNRSSFNHISCLADSWGIKNSNIELMVDTRSADGMFPALPEQPNLYFYGEVHSLQASGGNTDQMSYPSYVFEQIRENPAMVGGVLTYHRTATSGRTGQGATLGNSDLMFTTNPRQPFINGYLSGGSFQTGPHYETMMIGGTSLAGLAMETTMDGRNAYYGPSHSARNGKSNPVFFEVPQSPSLSLGSFQHCDISTTAFSCASQIGNSWASPYLAATGVSKLLSTTATGVPISPSGLGVYDYSYLANETLFDAYYLSGAAPRTGYRNPATGSPAVWTEDQISEEQPVDQVLAEFFADPRTKPLNNPRMTPYNAGYSNNQLKYRLEGPAKCVRLAGHLLVEGGFNINSTSEEAWAAMLASLRGVEPASKDRNMLSRFRHILTEDPAKMVENDGWTGFRSITDTELRLLAKNIVKEVKTRGPFLSLGEFVNRRISSDRGLNLAGALQSAIDASGLNRLYNYATFATESYPNRENLGRPDTGTNTPGWLTQADVLTSLAPFITPRSDTFTIRSLGEARSPSGAVIASVLLEATVQRIPDWLDPTDDIATRVEELTSTTNRDFGRRFAIISIRKLIPGTAGNPI